MALAPLFWHQQKRQDNGDCEQEAFGATMIETFPWVMVLFYITAGYLLVVGVTCSAVTLVSSSARSRFTYGSLAVVGISGAGVQIACVAYYLAVSEPDAVAALAWQTDFASLAIISACLYLGLETRGGVLPGKHVFVFALAALLLIVANRASTFTLHFTDIPDFELQPHPSHPQLRYLQGVPGAGAWFWFSVMGIALTVAAYWVWSERRDLSAKRVALRWLFIVLMLSAVLTRGLIDFGVAQSIYWLGFAITAMVLWVSIHMAIDAAERSRQLLKREREMQGEIRQRRKAEDKLQRLSQVFMQAPAATHIVDLGGRTLQVNEESVRFLRRDVGASPKVNFLLVLEHLGVDKMALLDELSDGKVKSFGPYFFTAGVPVDALYVVRDAWLTFKIYPIFDHQRQLQEFVVRLEDVTEQQFVDNAINAISTAVSAETGRAFFNQLVINLARLLNKKYVYIGLRKHHEEREFIETTAVAVDGELVENFAFELDDSPSLKALSEGSYAVPRQLMQEFPEHHFLHNLNVQSYIGAAIRDVDKNAIGVIAVLDSRPMDHVKQLQEILNIFVSRAGTELHRLEAENRIRKMAYEDFLTGLPNRTQLNEHVSQLLADDVAGGSSRAFVQVDLDHFKTINDALGHDVGDDVLRHIGLRLRQHLPDDVLVARIGGDEFAIVYPRLGSETEEHLDRIVQQLIGLMEQPVKVGEHLLDVGCTLGVVLFPEFARTAVDVFRHADIALNKAKTSGRGGYHLFTPEMRESVSKRLTIEKGLRAALQRHEFALFYQPQVNGDGDLTGAEALIRWHHPQQGWIPPAMFIPVAEETGLINPIGQWVLAQALTDRKRWTEAQVPFTGHLSINVSPWQFARPDFVDTTIGAIEKMQVPPNYITLEVTESALLTDLSDTIEKLRELRRFGVTIALDDFGTGYSSLAYLRDLPLDILKIDKAFVDALETNIHEPLVESMISIGRHMGLQVIAEGVETRVQLERLRALGCTVFQGYLFSRPLAEPQFIEWLKSSR